jgi:hypothetical protein
MKKDSTLLLRLSSNQKKLITAEAKKLNISTSELIRRILINGIQ